MTGEILVVSGAPRSGTSMMMAMLSAGGVEVYTDGARAADAFNPRGYFEHRRVVGSATDASWVTEARGRAVKVVHPLLAHLPATERYRVVVMSRPLDEVVRSWDAMLGTPGAPGICTRLERDLEEAREGLRRRREVRWTEVRYLDALADPWRVARAVARFAGRELDLAAMASVVDPRLRRVRGPGPALENPL